MTTRKLQRRRNAIRSILQNLETRPFCEDHLPHSGGWLSQPRPRLSRSASSGGSQGDRR
jgi:hypothetical protein